MEDTQPGLVPGRRAPEGQGSETGRAMAGLVVRGATLFNSIRGVRKSEVVFQRGGNGDRTSLLVSRHVYQAVSLASIPPALRSWSCPVQAVAALWLCPMAVPFLLCPPATPPPTHARPHVPQAK